MAYGNGTSSRWPVAIVLVASIDDPRIRQSQSGEPMIQVAIPKPKEASNTGVNPKKPESSFGPNAEGDGKANPVGGASRKVEAAGGVNEIGRLRYSPGFKDVWVDDDHYDLRTRRQAQLCLEYLVNCAAFDVESAKHLTDEIDPYVRQKGGFRRRDDVRIDHYFNANKRVLPQLRKRLIVSAGRNGRFFLKVK